MKAVSYLIALSVAFAFFGCDDQYQRNQKKREPMASKSGELVFGDKKVTYFIEFVFLEQRHSTYYGEPKDYPDISMDTIVDDIEILRKKFEYDKIYVLGHSINGLIAIEYSRKYPQNTSGVIMINTPPHFHNDYMDIVSRNWNTNATEERKMVCESNKERLKKMNLDSLPETERAFMQYKANAPMYWYDPLYDISSVFRGFRENTSGWNHFFALMRDCDIARSEINIPIFLSLGSYDFMVPQSLWDDYIDKFPTLSVKRFMKSGHSPHVEERELFDDQLLSWIKNK